MDGVLVVRLKAARGAGSDGGTSGSAREFEGHDTSRHGNNSVTNKIKLADVHTDMTEIRVYLMLLPGTTGQVYFDDIELTTN